MDIIYSKNCTKFKREFHPESPERVENAASFLKENKFNFIEPELCSEEKIKQVHTSEHLEKVKNNRFSNSDCPNYKDIYQYARLSAGAAIKASKVNGFSLMRPPGHHAGADYVMGFCYFNNIAIAVQNLDKNCLIIDIDGHHGNGTQDIFAEREDITYLSLHKNIFPGTGNKSFANNFNHTFTKIPGDQEYLDKFEQLLNSAFELDINYEVIAISAGFDSFAEDPLASLGITAEGFKKIGKRIARIGLPVFCVLEGGYNVEMLGKNIHSFLVGLEKPD